MDEAASNLSFTGRSGLRQLVPISAATASDHFGDGRQATSPSKRPAGNGIQAGPCSLEGDLKHDSYLGYFGSQAPAQHTVQATTPGVILRGACHLVTKRDNAPLKELQAMAIRILWRQNLKKMASSTLLIISQTQLISPYPLPLGLRSIFSPTKCMNPHNIFGHSWSVRWASYGQVNLVLSDDGRPKFQIEEVDPSKKRRYLTKKRLKVQRKREKTKRKEANKNDPRRIRPKGKKIKQKFPTAEARLKYKIEKAKLKEAMLVEKLKKYEVAKAQGPMAKPDDLTGEERFYLKKVSQKKSNYVPVGRRGVFGGVILNMHLHWKKHETVKVICKPSKPGQIQEYATEIARLSGGVPVNIIGDNTIVFYRGKNYAQPDVMSPIDTLSKKKALEKSKYEQSLETVRRFIAVSEKELELYYRHVALYGSPQYQHVDQDHGNVGKAPFVKMEELNQGKDQNDFSNDDISDISESDEVEELNQGKDQNDSFDVDISDISESDVDDCGSEYDANDEGSEDGISTSEEIVISGQHDCVLPSRV